MDNEASGCLFPVRVSIMCFLQCFDTVDWVTEMYLTNMCPNSLLTLVLYKLITYLLNYNNKTVPRSPNGFLLSGTRKTTNDGNQLTQL